MLLCSCLPFTLILGSPCLKVSSCSEFTAEIRRKCLTIRVITNLKMYWGRMLGSTAFTAKATVTVQNPTRALTGSGLFVRRQRPNSQLLEYSTSPLPPQPCQPNRPWGTLGPGERRHWHKMALKVPPHFSSFMTPGCKFCI